jgi:N6-L-threonylcarbamoyladenine synthase
MIGRVAVEQYKQNDFISIDEIDVQTRIKEF